MLFSEPKIPQTTRSGTRISSLHVSVLFSEPKIPQTTDAQRPRCTRTWFQCSSASRKFLKLDQTQSAQQRRLRFSALQRAENSSNTSETSENNNETRFSALQRAENSSNLPAGERRTGASAFQCSSASRKFLKRRGDNRQRLIVDVSVLFSEPKIPQTLTHQRDAMPDRGFSALQRAENSSNRNVAASQMEHQRFQCSSASRKFLN